MPSNLPAKCSSCGVKRRDGHVISRRGLCRPCGLGRVVAAVTASSAVDKLPPKKLRRLAAMVEGWNTPMGGGGASVSQKPRKRP